MRKPGASSSIIHDRNPRNREKKVDTSIAAEIVSDSYERMDVTRDEVTLVAGDSDFVPTVEKLRSRGFTFTVMFWQHASRELREAASSFVALDSASRLPAARRLTAAPSSSASSTRSPKRRAEPTVTAFTGPPGTAARRVTWESHNVRSAPGLCAPLDWDVHPQQVGPVM